MNVDQMRQELYKKYGKNSSAIKKMKDSQVQATYFRLKQKDQI